MTKGTTEGSFGNLPAFTAQGAPIEYTVSETKVGSDDVVDGKAGKYAVSINGTTITNTYVPEKTTINVKKVWEGGSEDSHVPVTIQLFRVDTGLRQEFGEPVELNGDNEWSYQWTDLDETNEKGDSYTYLVEEISAPEFYNPEITGTGTEVDPFVVTNTYNTERRNVNVKLNWIGGPIPRPNATIGLYRQVGIDGEPQLVEEGLINPINLQDGDNSYTWTNLPRNDGEGNKYIYSVRETKIGEEQVVENRAMGYSVGYSGSDEDVLIITNTFTETGTLEILKTDELNRPLHGAEFVLYEEDGTTPVERKTTGEDGLLTFEGLETNEKYILKEITPPEGYIVSNENYIIDVDADAKVEVFGDGSLLESSPLIVENKLDTPPEPETTRVVVHKTWVNLLPDDEPNNHTATFKLNQTDEEKTVQGNGIAVFENLPKFDDNGDLIKYTVEEQPLEGFETLTGGNAEDGFVFTNYPTEKFGVVLQKLDSETNEVLEGAEFELWKELAKESNSLPVKLELEADASLNEDISVTLVKDGDLTDQVVTLNSSESQGELSIDSNDQSSYAISLSSIDGLDISVSADNATGFTILLVNSNEELSADSSSSVESIEELKAQLETEKSELENLLSLQAPEEAMMEKFKRIEEIEGILLNLNSTDVLDIGEITTNKAQLEIEKSLVEDNISQLEDISARSNSRLEEIRESINQLNLDLESGQSDEEIDSINLEIQGLNLEAETIASEKSEYLIQDKNLRNQLSRLEDDISKLNLQIEDIHNNTIGKPALEIELEILKQETVGIDKNSATADPLDIQRVQNNIENLERLIALREEQDFEEGTGTITNEALITMTSSLNSQIGTYQTDEHGLIIIGALEPGEYYFIESKAPDNYEIIGEGVYEFSVPTPEDPSIPVVITVKNNPIPTEKVDIRVEKNWVDKRESSLRPTITIKLLDGNTVIRQIELNNGQSSYIFKDLEKYQEDRVTPINYSVMEDRVIDYEEAVISGNMNDGFVITNKEEEVSAPNPVVGNIRGIKTWQEDRSIDRPQSITVELYKNGLKIDERTVTSADNWAYNFGEQVLVEANGSENQYEVREIVPFGYQVTYNGYSITNTKTSEDSKEERIRISGEKTWLGDTASDRPSSITLILYRDGLEVNRKSVDPLSNWRYDFGTYVLLEEDGTRYSYRIEERVPIGYRAVYSGFNITNIKTSTDPVIPIIPTDPVIPSDPTDPMIPVDPIDPTKPIIPVDPTNPVKPVIPVEPTEPIDPIDPAEPVKPDDTHNYIEVVGKKIWLGGPSTKPAVKLQLKQNGIEYGEAAILEGETEYKWTGLPRIDEKGRFYVYSVDEVEVPKDYTKTISGMTVTNTHKDYGKVTKPSTPSTPSKVGSTSSSTSSNFKTTTPSTSRTYRTSTIPKTSDPAVFWGIMSGTTALLLGAAVVSSKKLKGKDD